MLEESLEIPQTKEKDLVKVVYENTGLYETTYRKAHKYNVRIAELKAWNRPKRSRILKVKYLELINLQYTVKEEIILLLLRKVENVR